MQLLVVLIIIKHTDLCEIAKRMFFGEVTQYMFSPMPIFLDVAVFGQQIQVLLVWGQTLLGEVYPLKRLIIFRAQPNVEKLLVVSQ